MNYYELEKHKRNLKMNLRACKDDKLKQKIKNDIEIIDKKQFKMLEERARVDERTGSFI